jgi:hypothetical protein
MRQIVPQPPRQPFDEPQTSLPPEQAGAVHMRYGVGVEVGVEVGVGVVSAEVGISPRSVWNSGRVKNACSNRNGSKPGASTNSVIRSVSWKKTPVKA